MIVLRVLCVYTPTDIPTHTRAFLSSTVVILSPSGNMNVFSKFSYNVNWQRTLRAGKLTERILNLFIATGKEEVLSLIESLNIQHVLTPVLPTSKSFMYNIHCTPILGDYFLISLTLRILFSQDALRNFNIVGHSASTLLKFEHKAKFRRC